MATDTVESFIRALGKLERDRDVGPITELFHEDARIGNVVMTEPLVGRGGARSFWTMYRDSFEAIASRFEAVFAGEDRAALEWTATGTGHRGQPISYQGVSVLELENGLIKRFTAYFDSAALGNQLGNRLQPVRSERR